MYTRFRVKNFKGFRDVSLDQLARLNLIAGKNNTGKTSLLEALLMGAGHYIPEVFLRVRGDDRRRSALPTSRNQTLTRAQIDLQAMFFEFDTEEAIEIHSEFPYEISTGQLALFGEVNSTQLLMRLLSMTQMDELPQNFERDIELLERSYGEGANFSLDDVSILRLWRQPSVEQDPIYFTQYNGVTIPSRIKTQHLMTANFMSARGIVSPIFTANQYSNLILTGNTDIFVESLKIIEPRLKSILLLQPNNTPELYGTLGFRQPLPFSAMGEGFSQLASIILMMASAQDGILLIDEIENGLHYSVLPDVWRAIYKAAELFNVQVFATTHSHEMIAAAQTAFVDAAPNTFCYHRLNRHKHTGEISSTTYDIERLSTALELDFEVR